jgi:hypothetical protein
MNFTDYKTVLFTTDCNYHEKDPYAVLVRVYGDDITEDLLDDLEELQPGAGRIGGNWPDIMKDGGLYYEEVSFGRLSEYTKDQYDWEHRLISGNY